MTILRVFIGTNLLLASSTTAFQPASPAVVSRQTIVSSEFKHTSNNNQRFGSVTLYESTPDDGDGFDIRTANSAGRRQETTFGAENVPVEQRPSNEYLNLIQQPTFGWASQDSGDLGLVLRLSVLYAVLYLLVCYPISGATYINDGYLLQKVTSANVGAMSVVFVLVLRLYSGWGYIGSRLQSKVIEYEETGWYDGDFEQKSDAEKARDLFLYRSNVKPVEDRLKKFSLAVGAAWVASIVALNVANNAKPIFNQYDARMLEKLSYDDKVASVVQQQSNGRPTYCENRYYRAVANGGQGCN